MQPKAKPAMTSLEPAPIRGGPSVAKGAKRGSDDECETFSSGARKGRVTRRLN